MEESGQRIIRAILDGERDGYALAKLRHFRVRVSEEEIAKALEGTWREELYVVKVDVSHQRADHSAIVASTAALIAFREVL